METTGVHAMNWLQWSWASADAVYQQYIVFPVMMRESLDVKAAVPREWQQIEAWLKPKFIAALPDSTRHYVSQQGMAGVVLSVSQCLFRLMRLMAPGSLDEKDLVLKQLQSPKPCRSAAAALTELSAWMQAARRIRELGLAPPDVSLLYRGARSIYSAVLEQVGDESLKLRWQLLEGSTGDPHVLTLEGLKTINAFAVGS